VSSNQQLIRTSEAYGHGLRLKSNDVPDSRFSASGIDRFLRSEGICGAQDLHKRVTSHISRFVRLRDDRQYRLLALWIMGTYVFSMFRYFPYIHVHGEKGSGKSLLGAIVRSLAFNAVSLVNPTVAVLFRHIDRNRAALVIDEAESLRGSDRKYNSPIFEVLNQGFSRDAQVVRCSGNNFENVRSFAAYCPKMIVGINELDNVLGDRVIPIWMLRRRPTEIIERFTESHEQLRESKELVDQLYAFGLQNAATIAELYHGKIYEFTGVENLENRQADLWMPLIVLSRIVDGERDDLTQEMLDLAMEHLEQRVEEDAEENEALTLLRHLEEIALTIPPHHTDGDAKEYLTGDVLEFLKGRDITRWYSLRKLSSEMRRAGFPVKVSSLVKDGKSVRVYPLSLPVLKDLRERYGGKSDV
jgi:hypothetical protein